MTKCNQRQSESKTKREREMRTKAKNREWKKLMLAKINKFNELNISYETFGEFERGAHTQLLEEPTPTPRQKIQ